MPDSDFKPRGCPLLAPLGDGKLLILGGVVIGDEPDSGDEEGELEGLQIFSDGLLLNA